MNFSFLLYYTNTNTWKYELDDFRPGKSKPFGRESSEHATLSALPNYITSVPDIAFPYELGAGPASWIPRLGVNLVHYRRAEFGGHFAALSVVDSCTWATY